MAARLTQEAILDRAMQEDSLLHAVMDLLAYNRWLAHHVRRSDRGLQMGDPGYPDVIAARPPRLLVVELKRQEEKPFAAQEAWLDAYRAVPGIEVYVWRPSDYRTGIIEGVLK